MMSGVVNEAVLPCCTRPSQQPQTTPDGDWRGAWQRELERAALRSPRERTEVLSSVRVDLPAPASGPAAAQAPASLPQAASRLEQHDPQALRIHAQWSQDGVQVWVGASRTGLPSAQRLVAPLRAGFERQGHRLLGLVVNGQTVMDVRNATDLFLGETPWPQP
jgi:hypothetical protein